MGRAGAAMQQQHLDRGVIAEASGPDVEGPLRRRDGDPLHAAAQHVVAACIVQIRGEGAVIGAHTDLQIQQQTADVNS